MAVAVRLPAQAPANQGGIPRSRDAPERGPHGEAVRAAVAEVLADSGPEPAARPAVPKRYATTLRLLADPPPTLTMNTPEE